MPTDEYSRLLAENERYAEQFELGRLGPAPLAGLAILTCMDARMVLANIFGLRPGDANVLRNAGGVATDDVIRSLVLSQRVLGTREIVVLGHTGCGLRGLAEEQLRTLLKRKEVDAHKTAAIGYCFGGLCVLGTFSQFAVVSEFSCIPIPEDIPFTETRGFGHVFAFTFNTPGGLRVCDRVTSLSGTAVEFF